jgi:hypothetical protein
MKSTTIRFADPVYAGLVQASRVTGLPINSIVTVACLEWLRANGGRSALPALTAMAMPGGRRGMASSGEVRRRMPERWAALQIRPLTPPDDPLEGLTASAQDALAHAQELAERGREPWVGTHHLLRGLAGVSEGRAAQALERLGVDVDAVVAGAVAEEPEPAASGGAPPPTRQLRRVVRLAQDEAGREGAAQVGTDHLLLGLLLDHDSRVAEALEAAGVTERAAREALAAVPPEA